MKTTYGKAESPGTGPGSPGSETAGRGQNVPVARLPQTPDRSALLEMLFREHFDWMIGHARTMGIGEPDIPVVDALITVARKFDPKRPSLRGFACKILWDHLNSAYRAQAKRASRTEPLPSGYLEISDERTAEGDSEGEELARRLNELRAAVELLPRQYRDIIKHRYYEEQPSADV